MVAADARGRDAHWCPAGQAPQGQHAAAETVTIFGDEMRRLMAERRVGLRALARQVSYDPGYLSKVVNGRRAVSGDLARRLDAALGADGSLKAFRVTPDLHGTFAYDDEERLILAARHPKRLDREIIRSLAEALDAEYGQAYRVGSVTMLKTVTVQLSVVTKLAREARAPVRGEILVIAAQYAHFAGWLNATTGRPADAGECYDRALGWAVESGDADMTATTLNLKAGLAWFGGKVGPMIGLSQAAQRSASTSAGVRALAAQLEARGNALQGDGDDANRKLDESASLIEQHATGHRRNEIEPPWIICFCPAHLKLQRGLASSYLGRNALAAELLSAGLAEMPPGVMHCEWTAWYHMRLAAAHARAGDPEQACSVAAQAALIARQVESSRLRAQLIRLLAQLSAQWPTLPAVADLGGLVI
jgi:transcriptional regulator with XRE-family HTH domain